MNKQVRNIIIAVLSILIVALALIIIDLAIITNNMKKTTTVNVCTINVELIDGEWPTLNSNNSVKDAICDNTDNSNKNCSYAQFRVVTGSDCVNGMDCSLVFSNLLIQSDTTSTTVPLSAIKFSLYKDSSNVLGGIKSLAQGNGTHTYGDGTQTIFSGNLITDHVSDTYVLKAWIGSYEIEELKTQKIDVSNQTISFKIKIET